MLNDEQIQKGSPAPRNAPHGHHGDVVAEALGVDIERGLSEAEARARLERDGPNLLAKQTGQVWWRVLLRQFSSIVVWLLAAAAVVSWFTDGLPEAISILIVLTLNAGIGFAIEWRAGTALDALRSETLTHARVRRNGQEYVLDAAGLVVGDVIILTAGDRVPADARLLEAASLQLDESALTGESFPTTKSVERVAFSAVLTERRSMLYLGTMVVSGRGTAIVTGTGQYTEIGRIGQLIAKTESEPTPLERRLASLGKTLVYVVLAIAVIVWLVGFLRGDDPALMLKVSLSLAVAAVPEALPAMTTLILALGVLRMARQRAIVRKLSAVETLGCTTVICSDKTGTMTENRMEVQEYRLADGRVVETETGSAAGTLLERLTRVSVLCNEASLGSNQKAVGDPTETALLIAASRLGIDASGQRSKFDKVLEEPFDAVSKRMITVLKNEMGDHFAVAKGAPSVLLGMCSTYASGDDTVAQMDEQTAKGFRSVNDEMASRGLRVLAFAERRLASRFDDLHSGYTFLGLAGMNDPPRDGVAEAIQIARIAGIRVIMLTGDQVLTAKTIASKLGLTDGDGDIFAIHASEIAGADDAELAAAAAKAHVFARVSPEDKLKIVEALQRAGEIVAVTGDGINDAPALKRANIGIAMGMRGTEVAKEAADMVLTDDNFPTIVKAIEGGRSIYANIIKFVHLMFSHNLGEVLFIFSAVASGLPLPLMPLQILWVNLVTDVFPALSLAAEPPSRTAMTQRPRSPGETMLSHRFLVLIGWQGAMLAAITLAAYLWALNNYGEGPHARTVALMAIVSVQLGHTFNCRSRTRSVFREFFSNPWIFAAVTIVVLLQVAALYIKPLANVLGLVEPGINDLLVMLGCVFLPVLIVEATKQFYQRMSRKGDEVPA